MAVFGLEHCSPEEAARYLYYRFGKRKFSPSEWSATLLHLPGMPPFEHVPSASLPPSFLGWTVFNENSQPVLVQINKDQPYQRRRFTEAHEVAHIIRSHKPTFSQRPDILPRIERKRIILQGINAPLWFQWWKQNEDADRLAGALMVPEAVLLQRYTFPFRQLCQEFIASAWTVACAVVRAQPQPTVAIPFTKEGPVGPFIANQSALRPDCGLFEFLLHQLWIRPFITDWPQVEEAARSTTEIKESWNQRGYVLDCLFFPAHGHPFFLRGRGEWVTVIGLFTQNQEASTVHKIPGTPQIFPEYGFNQLKMFVGPVGSDKSGKLLDEIQRERAQGREVQVFRLFGDNDGADNSTQYLTDRTGVGLLEKVSRTAEVVAIDDLQYAHLECAQAIRLLLAYGKKVIVAGPLRDMRGFPFDIMASLNTEVPPENVVHCRAQCAWPGCTNEATESQLIGDVPDDVYHMVTNRDAYQAVCRKHFYPAPLPPSQWPSHLGFDAA